MPKIVFPPFIPGFFLAAALLFAGLTSHVRAQASVADEFLSGYLLCVEGEALEKSGKLEQAYQKYTEASKIIDAVALNRPDWQPSVLDYRRKEIRKAFARIRAQLPEDSPLRRGASAADQNFPSLPRDDRSPARAAPRPNGDSPRLDAINADSQRLLEDLDLKRASLEETQQQLARSRRAQEDLANRLRDAENRLAKGGSDTDSRALRGEIARLESELNIANEAITRNDSRYAELQAAHEKANADIAALSAERDELLAERDKLSLILKDSETGEMKALLAENASLRDQLRDATESIRNLTADNTAKDEEIHGLRSRIKDIEGQLVKLREENDESKRRLTALADKLRKTSGQLNETVAKSREGVGEEILKENQVLQAIIRRQIMQQARRRDAKQLVMTQLAKLEIDSGTLLESVERLAGESFTLSDAEREVLESPTFRDVIDEAGGIALFHKADGNAAAPEYPEIKDNEGEKSGIGLNQDLTLFAKAANYDFGQGNFPAAEAAYQRVLDLAPDNIYILRNLGLTKLRVGKPDEAEQLFLKAIAFDPDNDYSNFILGHHYYGQADYARALAAMNQVIELNPGHAKAHYYLGAIYLRNSMNEDEDTETRGKMNERARAEFEKVVAIDPKFADAHFNLAFLYLSRNRPDLARARGHYRSYLISGGRSDPAMEQNLGS